MSKSSSSFFDTFRNEFPNLVYGEGDKLPFDVGRSLLTEEELEGECLDWSIQFLNSRYFSGVEVFFSALEAFFRLNLLT